MRLTWMGAVLDTTIWHSLRPGEPGAARNRKHGVRGQTSSNIPENERVLEGQDAVRAEGGDGVLLEAACVGSTRHPAAAALLRWPGVRFRGPVLAALAARLGLSWSPVVWSACAPVCVCVGVQLSGRTGKSMAFAPEPGPCTPIIQTLADSHTPRQVRLTPAQPALAQLTVTVLGHFPWQPLQQQQH